VLTEEVAFRTYLLSQEMTSALMTFLEKNTNLFMKELWGLLIEAQESPEGIPLSLVKAKQDELRKRQEEIQRIQQQVLQKAQTALATRQPTSDHTSASDRPPEGPSGEGEKPRRRSRFDREASASPPRKHRDRDDSHSPPKKHKHRRRSRSRSRSPSRKERREGKEDRHKEKESKSRRDRDSKKSRRDREERDGDRKSRDRSRERSRFEEATPEDAEESAALKVIGATLSKVSALEEQDLDRVVSGRAGVKEVEAVAEFLTQALEALDAVNGNDVVREARSKAVRRVNGILDRIDQVKEDMAKKKKRDGDDEDEDREAKKPKMEDVDADVKPDVTNDNDVLPEQNEIEDIKPDIKPDIKAEA